MGDASLAREELTAAQAADGSGATLALLSAARWALGERDGVMADLESWLRAHPDDVAARNMLAGLRLELDDSSGAADDYRRLLEGQPDNLMALNNLAWLTRATDTQEALALIERADRLAPDSAEVKDTYAMVLMETGDYRRALAMNGRALDIAGNSPPIRLNRAQILLRAGRADEARTLLEELVKGPAPTSDEARALLSGL
jgi:tetratricopeptide (TPR) repeat protein